MHTSPVVDHARCDRYCVGAKHWREALQKVRARSGQAGTLAGFLVEVMLDGYRAVDPKARIRYVVIQAPTDAPLREREPEKVPAPKLEAAPDTLSAQPPVAGPTSAEAPDTERVSAPLTEPAAPPRPEPAASAAAADAPTVRQPEPAAAPSPAPAAVASPPRPSAESPQAAEPTSATQPSMMAPQEPGFWLVRKREENPSAETPITYREYAYAVEPGTDRQQAQTLLWMRFKEVCASISGEPPGKFVQLAVFDHVFKQRPTRPPIATLAWKDWRGDPVVHFPSPSEPPPPSRPPGPMSYPPASASPTSPVSPEAPPSDGPGYDASPAPTVDQAEPPPVDRPGGSEAETSEPPRRMSLPSEPPPPAPRRPTSDELLTDLFDAMADLPHLQDSATAARFVLKVLLTYLPCAGALIHFFDLSTNEFVVVRAAGPRRKQALSLRTSERDPAFARLVRQKSSECFEAGHHAGFAEADRWKALGVIPTYVLSGPVRQHRRLLGAIELVNPIDGGPFRQTEANALDYMCERFAEFLSQRSLEFGAVVVR